MDTVNYHRVVQKALETPWSILPQKLAIIQEILIVRASGHKFTDEEINARLAAINTPRKQQESSQESTNIAVLPLLGTIIPRGDMFSRMSGATSVDQFQKTFRGAMADKSIDAIIIDVDSPGGQVGSIPEIAEEIFEARGQKPIVAIANNLAASAAYWIASSADELIVTPSSQVGSIGVFALHENIERALDMKGIDVTLISAGKFKVEGNPFESLSESAKDAIQKEVNNYYDMFVEGVARNRDVSSQEVVNGFGQGRVVGAREAIKLNMADSIGTFDDAVARAAQLASAGNFNINNAGVPSGNRAQEGDSGMVEKEVKSFVTLPDGSQMSGEEVYALLKEAESSRATLSKALIDAAGNEASDRGVAPYVIGLAKQLMGQLNMDAEPTLQLDLGEGEGVKNINLFGAISELLMAIPGRSGEFTSIETGDALPAEAASQNPYVSLGHRTTEEAESWAKQRRKKLGLVRNGNADDTELG